MRALPLGCHVSTVTFLSVFGAILGTLVVVLAGFAIVRLVKRVRRQWKEGEDERLDRQGLNYSFRGLPGWSGWVARLTGLFRLGEGQTEIQAHEQERQGNGESTPLLG